MGDPDIASPRPEMADPDPTSLQAAAVVDPDPTSLLAAMEAPITAALGPVGPLLRKLHSGGPEQVHLPLDEIRLLKVLCISLVNMSEDEDASFMVQWWMKIVRELCYDTEDRLDEVIEGGRTRHDFSHLLARVNDASEKRKRFHWSPKTINPADRGKAGVSRLMSHPSKSIVVEPPNKLVELLALDGDKQLRVIPIIGCAGVGKTTVARALYQKHARKFECRAFVSVSPNPDMRGFLTSLLSQLKAPQPPGFPDVPNHIDATRKHLEGKRYFIVVDDLWTATVWDIISRAFPRGDYCSRIITTTQIDDVSLACCSYSTEYIYKMDPLNYNESRKLFFGRVFGSEYGCPSHLKEVSDEIITQCGGLPLAIVSIADLLASEPNIEMEKWKYIHDSLLSTSEGMKDVLNIVYNSLPFRLRTCLLYLSMYPHGYVIKKEELVKQLVAEGFLGDVEGRDTEEIGEGYFDELARRGMVQAMETNNNGEVLSFTVHQMVLDFIRYKSMEENFVISVDSFQSTLALRDKARRLSIQFGGVKSSYIPKNIITSQVRSLIFWGFFKCVPSITEYGLLQVLVLHIWADQDKKSFDLTRIGELFRLKYLKIECNITVKLPAKIRRLKHLGTLEVDARLSAVPTDVNHLESLVHLRLLSEFILPRIVAKMASIRTLGYFDISSHSEHNVLLLGRATNLQDLQLTCSRLRPAKKLEKNLQVLGSILDKLRALQSVTLVPASGSFSAASLIIPCDGFNMVSPSDMVLRRIEISWRCCIFFSLPKWFGELKMLCILKIALTKLSREDIDILKGLPSLNALTLYIQTVPEESIFIDGGGFEVLTYFKFMCAAPCLYFVQGAMPKVQKLSLGFNANNMESHTLKDAGLHHLTCLTEISVKFGTPSVDEFDIKAAESALEAAIINHPNKLLIRVKFEGKRVTTLSKPQEDLEGQKRKPSNGQTSVTKEIDDIAFNNPQGVSEAKKETAECSEGKSSMTKGKEDTSLENRLMIPEAKKETAESLDGKSSMTKEKEDTSLENQWMTKGKEETSLENRLMIPETKKETAESLDGKGSMTKEKEDTSLENQLVTKGKEDTSLENQLVTKGKEDTSLENRLMIPEAKKVTAESSDGQSSMTKEKEDTSLENQLMISEGKNKKIENLEDNITAAKKRQNIVKNKEHRKNSTKRVEQYMNKQVDGRYARKDYVFTPWTHHTQSFDLLTGAMAPLLGKLLELINDEHNMKRKVRNNVESLHKELEAMHAALQDVAELEPTQLGGEARSWAKLVRDLSYDAEDVIDSLRVPIKGSRGSIKGILSWVSEFSRRGKACHEITDAINDIKKQAHDVTDLRTRYNVYGRIIANPAATSTKYHVSNLYTYPKELVGIKVPRDEVIRKLIDGTNEELKIVSIVGIGGLGKTTLAKSVYDRVHGRFDCRAFVSLSRKPDLKKVFMEILLQIDKQKYMGLNGATLDVKKLTVALEGLLANRRYLIVFDDIWDAPSWEMIKCALIDSKCGSRVVITTRVFNVAERGGGVYKLNPLSWRDSRALFNKRLFYDKEVRTGLLEVYEKLLLECGGVPLAIITMASWLAQKSVDEMSKVSYYISFDNGGNSDGIKTRKILLLSYYNLPYHLRACLLHLHIFPMDYVIKKETLIWKWAAEGFIIKEPGRGLFELGERYFKELINRNLVMPVEDNSQCGMVVGCRVSSLVLDMICSLSTRENFVTVLDGPPMESKARRLAVHKKAMEQGDPLANSRQESMRSFNTTGCHFSTKLSLSRFKLLRIISIEECTFFEGERHNLKYLRRLPQLRYLGLYNTPIDKLPKEIGDLLSLQTLDLRGTTVKELPWRLVCLRQLKCLRADEGTAVPDWMCNLLSLEELRLGEVGMSVNFVNELGRLTELRELEIWIEELDERKEKSLVMSMRNLKKIQVLRLLGVSSSGDEANWECYMPPGQLRDLHITTTFSRLPAWINVSHVPMLSYLHVNVKSLLEQDLENLGNMRELVGLKLLMPSNVFHTIKGDGAFPRLRHFETSAPVRFLPGAMPCLEFFRFKVDTQALTPADFDFSTLGSLSLLQKVEVEISSSGGSDSSHIEAVHVSLKGVVDNHPNSPNLMSSHQTNQIEITC